MLTARFLVDIHEAIRGPEVPSTLSQLEVGSHFAINFLGPEEDIELRDLHPQYPDNRRNIEIVCSALQ